jgi:hypothetical protein
MRSGDRPGLQNRWTAGHPAVGGFDSHSLPPILTKNAKLGQIFSALSTKG